MTIKLALRSLGKEEQLLTAFNNAARDDGDLITCYYIGDGGETNVYIPLPGHSICEDIALNKKFKDAKLGQGKLDKNQNYSFTINQSALAKFASNVVNGGSVLQNDLLVFDAIYLEELNKKNINTLKAACASGWAGDFAWAAISFSVELGVKVAEGTSHAAAMSATHLGSMIVFPFFLGILAGYANYRGQIADYEAKYGVSPPPEMLQKIKNHSISLSFQVCCAVGGWTLAYELAIPAVNALIGLFEMSALTSTPAYWVTVIAVGLCSALFVVLACKIAEHFLKNPKSEDNIKTDYVWLATCAFAAGSLFMLCFAVPGLTGLKDYLLNEVGMVWSRIICGLTSSILIGAATTSTLAYYHYDKNWSLFKNDPGSNCAAIKGFVGLNQQPDCGPRLAL